MFFLIEFQDFRFNFLTHGQHFRWVTHTTPCQIGDVQQAVNAAQINERTVVGDVFNDTFDNFAFFQSFGQFSALFAHSHFEYRTAAQDHVIAFAIQFDDFEFHGFALKWAHVFDRTQVQQRAWQERTNAVRHNGQTTFDFACNGTGHQFAGFQGFFQIQPSRQTLGTVA